MLSQEECELIVSFKRQLEEKIDLYNKKQEEIDKQEKELQILTDEIAKSQQIIKEYKETLSLLRKQIVFERDQLRAEETARHNQVLRNIRSSASVPCILLCSEVIGKD